MTSNINGIAIKAKEPIAAPLAIPKRIIAGAEHKKKVRVRSIK